MASNVITNSITSTFSAYVRRCLLLAVVSLLASVCFSQSRVEYIGFLKYSLDPTTKTAVLIGMKDKSYDGGENGVVIPDKVRATDGRKYDVVALGDSCFRGCGIKAVTVPSSVTSLGARCFYDCVRLKEISLPNVKSLGRYCFYDCRSLTCISLPLATSLGTGCFYYCTHLTTIDMPRAISLGDFCFESCRSLTYVSLPYTVVSIGKRCFRGCGKLKQITIPHNVTYLGDHCFGMCSNLEIGCHKFAFGDIIRCWVFFFL